MKQLRTLLEKYAKSETTAIETAFVESYLQKLQEKGIAKISIQADRDLEHRIHSKINKTIQQNFFQRYFSYLPIAASLLLLFSISLFGILSFPRSSENWQIKRANKGEQLEFYLSDSTQVYLSPGSELRYQASFRKQERKVYLRGEAFFKVAKKQDHQAFVVESTHLSVKVLGTQFNLQDVHSENATVNVHSGKVQVTDKENQQQQIVTKNQQVVYDFQTKKLQQNSLKDLEINEWFKGQIKFKSASLSEVINTLERRFDVVIDIKTQAYPTYKISGDFSSDNIEQVLQSLGFLYNITYDKINEKHIQITVE